jgi:hypothetical protein
MTDDLATRVYAAYYALKDELTAVLDLLDETRRERDEALKERDNALARLDEVLQINTDLVARFLPAILKEVS